MRLDFIDLQTCGGLNKFSLSIQTSSFTVLFDPCETISAAILSCLMGLDEVYEGQILIDGIAQEDYFTSRGLLSTFASVFDEGIMLANLSLRENLLLPWRKRFEGVSESKFDQDLQFWLSRMELSVDINLRPAHINAAKRKFLGFIRALLLKPQLLLVDDPYYLLNKTERALLFRFLGTLGELQNVLIASADDDFIGSIASNVVDLSAACQLFTAK